MRTLLAAVPRRTDLAVMLRLAAPVIVAQLGMVVMGTVDTMVVGRVSAEALAAVALGHLYFFATSVFGMGSLLALDPLVAQAVGSGDERAAARAVQRGLVIAGLLSVPTALVQLPGELVLGLLRQPAQVVPLAAAYARISAASVLPFFVFVVLRQSLQATRRLRPVVVIIVIANLVNLGLDIVLVFGAPGIPAMGALGSAWATLVCRWLLALGLLVLARRHLEHALGRVQPGVLERGALLRMLRLGLPIGVQFTLEIAAFGVIALLMGWLGATAMAAHQVAINLASLTFMVPVGVSAAAAVLVGQAIGGDRPEEARRAAAAALVCGAGFMAAMAALFLALPTSLARAYSEIPAVVALASSLIPIAGFFQVFDGLQVVSTGILRGLGDTRAPLAVNIAGFWLVGMPVSLLLAFRAGLGPEGLWWGFVAGLGAVALLLIVRVRSRMAGALERLRLD